MESKISERIKYKRKSSGLTQSELGQKVGVSDVTILRWERGERTPNSSVLPKLAEALNTSVEYLMGLNEDATPPPPVKQELPINNMKEKENDDLDLGYWGAMAEKAERVARSRDNGKKAAVLMMLRMAENAITATESTPVAEKKFIAVQENHKHVGDNYVKGAG